MCDGVGEVVDAVAADVEDAVCGAQAADGIVDVLAVGEADGYGMGHLVAVDDGCAEVADGAVERGRSHFWVIGDDERVWRVLLAARVAVVDDGVGGGAVIGPLGDLGLASSGA